MLISGQIKRPGGQTTTDKDRQRQWEVKNRREQVKTGGNRRGQVGTDEDRQGQIRKDEDRHYRRERLVKETPTSLSCTVLEVNTKALRTYSVT